MNKNNEQSIFARYRKIILAVILFMVADSLVIGINFYNTYKADESAISINLSGRQRMLSQRMAKVLLLLQRGLDANVETSIVRSQKDVDLPIDLYNAPANVIHNLQELDETAKLFSTTLKGFRDGDTVTGGDGHPAFLPKVETETSRQIVADADTIWGPYSELLQPLLGEKRNFSVAQLEEAVTYAQENNLKILRLMNDLTTDLEVVANKRASTLRIVLVIGIIVAFINFSYTVVISIRDLMSGDKKLAESRNENAEILATVHEGLFLLSKDKKLGTQFSESLPRMLHMDIVPGMDFMPILQNMVSPEVYESAVDYIELLLGERVKESLVTSLNPLTNVPVNMLDKFGAVQNRYLSFFFNRALVKGVISHVLVTVQDVTDKVLLMQQIEQAKSKTKIEVESLLRLAGSDFPSLQQFIDNTGRSLSQINEKLSQPQEDERARLHTLNYIMRLIHGIKGEAAILGIDVLENYAHESEQELVAMRESGHGLNGEQMLRVAVLLEGFYERYSSLSAIVSRLSEALGTKRTPPAEGAEDTEQTESARDASQTQTLTPGQPVQAQHPFAGQIAALAQRIAADHGKQVEISCQLEGFASLPPHVIQELQSISIQLVRNALTHGIETPGERAERNKPVPGALGIWCKYLGNDNYDFSVRDDGRGIVPERLRNHLVKSGRMSMAEASALSDTEIAKLIFQPGVSSAAVPDKDAGHGVGLDAVMEKVKAIHGRMQVRSRPDTFTEFHVQFSAAG
ncbi:MAG: type IV pili methyl-accepting chemotaxis transducer N-terminal domain-containing protein [Azoarcus sp.]|jgi:HPt (histidine-containing phosphotransfer) domain-containing protein|nr:type IV pili methyl-accepting chemotaxis transducer N-terminal domain-containing protein [Azoarcus sp.]